jgi:hypothetical protein
MIATNVALVSMPFAPLILPSIGLGLLKASMERVNIPTRVFYFSIRFAELIGERLYTSISQERHPHDLVGEWLFSKSLFGNQTDDDVGRYVETVLRYKAEDRSNFCNYLPPASDDLIERIMDARDNVEPFLEGSLISILDCRPRIVGFTSVFMQQIASLSLAKRIKNELS